jgi:hypothetical protein
VIPSGAIGPCGSNPSLRATSLDGSERISLPSRKTAPDFGASILARPRNSVDLPEPLAPTTTVKQLSPISTSRPSTMTFWS